MTSVNVNTGQRAASLEQTKALRWRDELCVKGKSDLWRLLQQVDPDKDIKDLIELQKKIRPFERSSLTSVIEFKRLCLQSGIDPEAVLDQIKDLVPGLKNDVEKDCHPVSGVLGLPLNPAAKAVWVGAFFSQYFSREGSGQAATSERVMEEAYNAERALLIVSLLRDGYHMIRGKQEVAKLEESLEPLSSAERESYLQRQTQLEEKIEKVIDDHQTMDMDFFTTFHELMLVKARLEPEKYAQFRTLIEHQIQDIKKSTKESHEQLNQTLYLAALDVTNVVLEILDPSGLLKAGASLVIKTQSLQAQVGAAYKTIENVRQSIKERKVAQVFLNDLINEAVAGRSEAALKGLDTDSSSDTDEVKDPDAAAPSIDSSGVQAKSNVKNSQDFIDLVNTAAKVNRTYWASKKESHVENVSLKTLSVVGGSLGLAGLACKILAIVGIAVGVTGLMACSMGLAGAVILALVLAFKALVYVRKHHEEIACQMRLLGLQVMSLFMKAANTVSFGRLNKEIDYYDKRIDSAKNKLEIAKLKVKLSRVGVKKLEKLAAYHFKVIKQTDMEEGIDLSTKVFFSITGKAPQYSFKDAKDARELQDRFMASVIDNAMS